MCGSMVDIQSLTAEIRRGKKEEERRRKKEGRNHRMKIIMSASAARIHLVHLMSLSFIFDTVVLKLF